MRLTAVSKVLDEADIIEAFVRHTAAFVSHQIILDNGSCDGTVEILKQLTGRRASPHTTAERLPAVQREEAQHRSLLPRCPIRHPRLGAVPGRR